VLGEEVAVVEGSGQADQREQQEHGHEEEDELVHGALDARQLVGLELGVEHELGVAACVDGTAVDEGGQAQRATAQKQVLAAERARKREYPSMC